MHISAQKVYITIGFTKWQKYKGLALRISEP